MRCIRGFIGIGGYQMGYLVKIGIFFIVKMYQEGGKQKYFGRYLLISNEIRVFFNIPWTHMLCHRFIEWRPRAYHNGKHWRHTGVFNHRSQAEVFTLTHTLSDLYWWNRGFDFKICEWHRWLPSHWDFSCHFTFCRQHCSSILQSCRPPKTAGHFDLILWSPSFISQPCKERIWPQHV